MRKEQSAWCMKRVVVELKTFLRRWHAPFLHPTHDVASCKSRSSELNPLEGNLEILLSDRQLFKIKEGNSCYVTKQLAVL